MTKKDDPKQYPTIPALIGKDIFLKVMEPEDHAQAYLWHLHSDPQSQTSHIIQLASPREIVESAKKKERTPNDGDFLMVRKEDNQPVGKIRYFNLNMLNRSAEFGIIVSPDERKNGYGKEGVRVLAKYLFTYLNLNKIYAQTASFNEAAIKLLKSLDFKLDGTLRQHHFYKGNLYDDLVFSLLRFESGFLIEPVLQGAPKLG
jgi:ribosomal-protein-alanine N-acetyltransferase